MFFLFLLHIDFDHNTHVNFEWEQATFRWDEYRFVLDQQVLLDFFIVVVHWNNSPWVLGRYVLPFKHIILTILKW